MTGSESGRDARGRAGKEQCGAWSRRRVVAEGQRP